MTRASLLLMTVLLAAGHAPAFRPEATRHDRHSGDWGEWAACPGVEVRKGELRISGGAGTYDAPVACPLGAGDFSICLRMALDPLRTGGDGCGIVLRGAAGAILEAAVIFEASGFHSEERPAVRLHYSLPGETPVSMRSTPLDAPAYHGRRTPLTLRVSRRRGVVTAYVAGAGDASSRSSIESFACGDDFTQAGLFASSGTVATVRSVTVTTYWQPGMYGGVDAARLDSLLRRASASDNPMEGRWRYADRTLDEQLLRLGGEYELLLVGADAADGEDSYDVYYLGGASQHPGLWRPGLLKGRLTRRAGEPAWRLVWVDAEGVPMLRGLRAVLEEENVLTLMFPAQNSTVRLRKAPP